MGFKDAAGGKGSLGSVGNKAGESEGDGSQGRFGNAVSFQGEDEGALSLVGGAAYSSVSSGLLSHFASDIGRLDGIRYLSPELVDIATSQGNLGEFLSGFGRLDDLFEGIGTLDPDRPIIPDPPASGGFGIMLGGTQFKIDPGSTVYCGTTASTVEDRVRVGVPPLDIIEFHANASVAPGPGETVTLTVRRDGYDTDMQVVISGNSVSTVGYGRVQYLSGADFSVAVVTSAGAAETTVGFSIKTQFQGS